MQSIAWHPNSAAGCIYAIGNAEDGVFVMSGLQHRAVCCRPWLLLLPEVQSRPPHDPVLAWSPDGSILVVAVKGQTALVSLNDMAKSLVYPE